MSKKRNVQKTRGAGMFTEAGFWAFIRSTLRNKSRYWKPISICKMNARRPYKGPLKRQKYEYQCNHCKQWFSDKNVNVDHIIPAGSLSCSKDLPGFVERLFCEPDGLQVLCTQCHTIKTNDEKKK